jgi:hypothetical protein
MDLPVDRAGIEIATRFLGQSFSGGTDICAPLEKVIARSSRNAGSRADLLIATDGEFGATPALAARLAAVKRELGLRVQGVLIADRETVGLLEIADHIHPVRDWRRFGGSVPSRRSTPTASPRSTFPARCETRPRARPRSRAPKPRRPLDPPNRQAENEFCRRLPGPVGDAFAATGPLPRVRALHLPPPPSADPGENKGEFCALELDDGSLGLSYVLLDDTLARLRAAGGDLGVAGGDALALARRYASADSFGKALGFATANALTRCLYDRAGFAPPASRDSIGEMEPRRRRAHRHDRPVSPAAGPRAGKRRAAHGGRAQSGRTGRRGRGLSRHASTPASWKPAPRWYRPAPCCSTTPWTACSAIAANARWFAMVGPGAGCLPDALFARGVTLIGGNWIDDGPGFVDALRRGESTSPLQHQDRADAGQLSRLRRPAARAGLTCPRWNSSASGPRRAGLALVRQRACARDRHPRGEGCLRRRRAATA